MNLGNKRSGIGRFMIPLLQFHTRPMEYDNYFYVTGSKTPVPKNSQSDVSNTL